MTVLADRRGADIVAVRRERPPIVLETEGEDYPLRKVQAGGWSHRRYQQRAENTWEHNARNVATEIARVVERVDARIVVVAGDVRALELIREDVPKEIAEKLHEVRGGRSEDGSTEAFEDAVDEAVVALVRRDKESLLDAFQQELGQHDRAVQGADRTLRALSMSQVEMLFVREELEPERTAWFGPDASRVALDRATLRELGIESATEATLVDVAIRAALGTGAGVLVLPADEGPDEGIGALLRWSAQR